MREWKFDVLVIGAGAAGAMAALAAADAGASVCVLARGYGATAQSPGVVDVCGQFSNGAVVTEPLTGVRDLVETQERHPYALLGSKDSQAPEGSAGRAVFTLIRALERFRRAMEAHGLPYVGELTRNRHVATVLGTIKTTCLVPTTADLDLAELEDGRLVVVGLRGYHDFDPFFVARSLATFMSHQTGVEARLHTEGAVIELPGLRGRPTWTATEIAYALDDPAMYSELETALEAVASRHPGAALLLPPALGYKRAVANVERLRHHLGVPVAEILPNPHSVPGQRLQRALLRTLRDVGVQVRLGIAALQLEVRDGRCRHIVARAEQGEEAHVAEAFVLASGDLVGGGLVAQDGWIAEPLTGARVASLQAEELVRPQFLAPEGHALFAAGLSVDDHLHPLRGDDLPVAENLFAAGALIGGVDRDREGSGMGIALGTGYVAGQHAAALAAGD